MKAQMEPGNSSGWQKLVSIDIDHTLLHTWESLVAAWRISLPRLAESLGISESAVSARLKEAIRRHITYDYPWWLSHAFASIWTGSVEEFVEKIEKPFWAIQDHFMETRLFMYPEVVPALSKLREAGFKVVLLSDATFYAALARVHVTGLSQYVDGIYALEVDREPDMVPSSEWLEFGDDRMQTFEAEYGQHFAIKRKLPSSWPKPQPFGILQMCEDFEVEPASVVHAGDSLVKDVGLVDTAGLNCSIWLPQYEVSTMTENDLEWIGKVAELSPHPSCAGVKPVCERHTLNELADLIIQSSRCRSDG